MRSGWIRPWTRFAALGLIACAALVASTGARADDPGSLRTEAERLRAESRGLAAEAQQALLDLYALESRLARAERRLAALAARRARLERAAAAARRQLEIARSDAAEAERRLAGRLRTLYVEGEVDPLAVLLGAESLDDALTAIDGLGRAAAVDGTILRQVRQTRAGLETSLRTLADRRAELEALLDEARAQRSALLGARDERAGYLAALERERALNGSQIAQLTAQATAAEREAAELAPPAGGTGAAPAPAPESAPADPPTGNRLAVISTGYCLRGRTATGIPTGWGVVAVDPAVIPLGTKMVIPGYGEGVAADTGSAVRGNVIDLWFPKCSQALAWGRRPVTITLL